MISRGRSGRPKTAQVDAPEVLAHLHHATRHTSGKTLTAGTLPTPGKEWRGYGQQRNQTCIYTKLYTSKRDERVVPR